MNMRIHSPTPPTRRIFSPNQKNWVDVIDHGEIAMSARKLEFITSFPIDGTNTFIFTNGESFFKDDNTFIIWNSNAILLFYVNENVAMHLKCEELVPPALSIQVLQMESFGPKIEV